MTYTKKNDIIARLYHFCAQDETRTHTILRPLPPQSSVYTNFTTCALGCPEQDSNLHTSRHAHSAIWAKKKSGKRDSNSRPRPWQGRALPTELFPQFLFFISSIRTLLFLKAGAKVLLFFDIHKFFCIFFAFFCILLCSLCARARPFLNIILYTRVKEVDFVLYNIFLPICLKKGKNN